MNPDEQRDRLTQVREAGSAGLFCPPAITDADRHLLDAGLVYVPVNPFRPFGPADRLKLTSDGHRWLKDNPAPPPEPPAPPAPPPDPPAHDDPAPDPEPAPVDDPPAPELDPPSGTETPPAPLPGNGGTGLPGGQDAQPSTAAHNAWRKRVQRVVAVQVAMREMAEALVPLATEARAAGILGGAGREVLPLTKRNARKWADAPKQYGLDQVDAE